MQRQVVDSSSIKSIGYDENSQCLEVEFVDEQIYEYERFPKNEFTNLIEAESIGKYFNIHVRNNYKFTKINWCDDAQQSKY